MLRISRVGATATAVLLAVLLAACSGNRPMSAVRGTPDAGAAGSGGGTMAGSGGAVTGAGGIAGTAGMTGTAGTTGTGCPPYQTFCNGTCIPTSVDPANCGACGHACAAGEACSAGVCSSSCTTATNGGSTQILKCGQLCVDKWNDNRNCGSCGNDCTASGKVCSGGACVASGLPGVGTRSCPNGGGPIIIDLSPGSETCAGVLAQTTFRFGLCACGNVSTVNSGQAWGPSHPGLDFPALYIDSYDSGKGPWIPDQPELGGSLGVNGTFKAASGAFTFLTGSWWNASPIDTAGLVDVKQELHAGSTVRSSDAFNVGQPNSASPLIPVVPGTASWDGYVIGNITASGGKPMTFWRNLFVPSGGSTRAGVVVKGATGSTTPDFTVPPPCDSCGAAAIPVAAIVDARAGAANDNATIGLDAGAMRNLSGDARLDLPCGSYYLDSIGAAGRVTIFAHGHTGLFIGGDARAAILSLSVDPGGSFDVFIKGSIDTSGDLVIGNPNYAALTRVYMAGASLALSGEAHFAGLFYAANSDINLTSHITAYGSLYCKNFIGSGDNTDIHYDRAALHRGEECGGGGTSTPGCRTCRDCGNQACINGTCAPCTNSSQCCAPLGCVGGICVVVPS